MGSHDHVIMTISFHRYDGVYGYNIAMDEFFICSNRGVSIQG
jgi:hypothetical protein